MAFNELNSVEYYIFQQLFGVNSNMDNAIGLKLKMLVK
jgi:hypothetical protein